MNLFLMTQEIDYSTAIDLVVDPNSVAGGSRGATSVQTMPTYGSAFGPYMQMFEGNLLLTTSMIVDMGGRPLKYASDGASVLSPRELAIANIDAMLKESGMD